MDLLIDVSKVAFQVTRAPEKKTDQNDNQKVDRETKLPLWSTQVMALDAKGGEMITITTAGHEPPKVNVGQHVVPAGLVAIPWNTSNGRSGVAYKATGLTVASGPSAAKAA